MFLRFQPSPEAIRRFISSQHELPFSYPEVGATAHELPPGYTVDRNRIKLGTGSLRTSNRGAAKLEAV